MSMDKFESLVKDLVNADHYDLAYVAYLFLGESAFIEKIFGISKAHVSSYHDEIDPSKITNWALMNDLLNKCESKVENITGGNKKFDSARKLDRYSDEDLREVAHYLRSLRRKQKKFEDLSRYFYEFVEYNKKVGKNIQADSSKDEDKYKSDEENFSSKIFFDFLKSGRQKHEFAWKNAHMENDVRLFLRCMTLESMMEERTFFDYRAICFRRIHSVITSASMAIKNIHLWRDITNNINIAVASVRSQADEKEYIRVAPLLADSGIWDGSTSAKEFFESSEEDISAKQKYFMDLQSSEKFEAHIRQLFTKVDEKFGTWIRRASIGVKSMLISIIAVIPVVIVMNAWIPTEIWIGLAGLMSISVGVFVYFGRRRRLKKNIAEIFNSMPRLKSFSCLFDEARDHLVGRNGTGKYLVISRILAFLVVSLFAFIIFATINNIFLFGEDRYLMGNRNGVTCVQGVGAVLWPGPGSYIVALSGIDDLPGQLDSKVPVSSGGRNRTVAVIKQDAISFIVRKSSFYDGKVPAMCSRLDDNIASRNSTLFMDSRGPVRSYIIPFYEDVVGCNEKEWGSGEPGNGAKMSRSTQNGVYLIRQIFSACHDIKPVIDVVGFSSEKSGQCMRLGAEWDADKMNLDLAEYRRKQVLLALGATPDDNASKYLSSSFVLDNANEKRWSGSINAMRAGRRINGGSDKTSRYVEIKILDGAGCVQ